MADLVIKLELRIMCKQLANLDLLSKTDPTCFVSMAYNSDTNFAQLGQTEQLQDNLNPKFMKPVIVEYHFEKVQRLRFEIKDQDANNSYELVGTFECKLSEIVGAKGQMKTGKLLNKSNKSAGEITIFAEEIKKDDKWLQQQKVLQDHEKYALVNQQGNTIESAQYKIATLQGTLSRIPPKMLTIDKFVTLHMQAKKLDKKDFFGSSDPYIQIFRTRMDGDNEGVKIYESEVIKNNLNPVWKPITKMPLQDLCSGDLNRKLIFKVFDWDRFSSPDFIGECAMSMQDILNAPAPKSFNLINEKLKQSKKKYENSGKLEFAKAIVENAEVEVPNPEYHEIGKALSDAANTLNMLMQQEAVRYKNEYRKFVSPYSFVQFLGGGLELSFLVAIDFTGSNGDPSNSSSLHYQARQGGSEYEQAIRAVGRVLEDYDLDRKYPCFGFGGSRYSHGTRHCFSLGGNPDKPDLIYECDGIDGIISAYKKGLKEWSLSGPTYFKDVILKGVELASNKCSQQEQKYFVLMIITDGEICDMDATIDAIIKASDQPLSIIIVGVGDSSFGNMDELDSDSKPLVSKTQNRWTSRDIVQFVPFRKFKNNPQLLAEETLREVPRQVSDFMQYRSIIPNAKYIPHDNYYYQQQQPPQQVQPPMMAQPIAMQPQPIVANNTGAALPPPLFQQ